jgi:hypothetical protein
MSSYDALLQSVKKKGPLSIANPLLNSSMLCIEGTAAIVSGEIPCPGTSTTSTRLVLYTCNLVLYLSFHV